MDCTLNDRKSLQYPALGLVRSHPISAGLNQTFQALTLDKRFNLSTSPSSTQKNIRFFIVRHGESLGQIDISAYQSPGDASIPLTDWGMRQSFEAGSFLKTFSETNHLGAFEIFSSTCLRTGQTAEHLQAALGDNLVVSAQKDIRLDKQIFGLFSGIFDDAQKARLYPEQFADYQKQIAEKGLFHARPEGGESIADVQRKASDFVRCAQTTTATETRNIIVVTHGLVALCLENALLNHGENWVLANMDRSGNCSIKLVAQSDQTNVSTEIGRGLKRPKFEPSSQPAGVDRAYV